MVFGIFALLSNRIDMLLVVLFCLATQANFFSPAKYGILPEVTGEEQLARANGLVELSTFTPPSCWGRGSAPCCLPTGKGRRSTWA